jgi:SAM-dependent methyltransferase
VTSDHRIEAVPVSVAARIARQDITSRIRRSAQEEASFQVEREYETVLASKASDAPSRALQELIPMDASMVLDLGCGAGQGSAAIASLYPWVTVLGVDIGEDFIGAARNRHESERVRFEMADFLTLPVEDDSADCVYADNTLEHTYDLDRTLAEIRRVLKPGGTLVAALPSDARNPRSTVSNHTWKTAPGDVQSRLRDAGFDNIELQELDLVRDLGEPPYAPSNDKMMYVRAWKQKPSVDRALVERLTGWVYRRLDPQEPEASANPIVIARSGHAWCWGYARVLSHLLSAYGVSNRMVAMFATSHATSHARGRGKQGLESHDVVICELHSDQLLVDPMANRVFDWSLADLLEDPALAGSHPAPDERHVGRQYELYDTAYWYSRVRLIRVSGKDFKGGSRIWPRLPLGLVRIFGPRFGWHAVGPQDPPAKIS